MLRDGVTGDWIGTFIGHKGAVWSSRLSNDATLATTGSADFTAKVWDPQTGECLTTIEHNHIVKAVAFPLQPNPTCVATGGLEKKLRVFDLTRITGSSQQTSANGVKVPIKATGADSIEVGQGAHTGAIKSVNWMSDYQIIVTASEDSTLRWWDLRTPQQPIRTFQTPKPILSCELNTYQPYASTTLVSPGMLSVAAGPNCYFFDGGKPGTLIDEMSFDHEVASVAINTQTGRVVTGGVKETWARVWDLASKTELEIQKGHHGPIWTISFSPDGKVYATGSEDGTVKLWKACKEPYGLWR